jgi:DNA polymerase-3 subunit gamma/tau
MSYQVIARKYRPQRFSEVVGQEHVTQTLSHAIEQKRIAHGYLFCGPRGTGKTTIARIFAKCLNCTDGPRVDFSDDDPRCREIAEGRSLDVFEIDGASNNGVEQVRELRETCKYTPASSRFKIYIIDEVHMLSTAAFNALLKTLEEPPAHVKFMFATTDPEKVLPTILSRCQRFDLRRIPAALIAKHLAQIGGLEKVKIDPAALYAIARGAEGAMRDAESALDQLISFCGDSIEEPDVLSMFGLAAQGQIISLSGGVISGQIEEALRQLNDLANHGKDLGRLLADLLDHFRNLLIFQVSRGDLNMLEVSEMEAAALKEQSKLVTVEGLTRILEVLADAEMRLRDAASKKILVEVTLLKAIEARSAVSLDSVLKQLQELRDARGGEVVSIPQPTPKPARADAPKPLHADPGARTFLSAATPESPATSALPASSLPAVAAADKNVRAPALELLEQMAPVPSTRASVDLELLWTQLLEAVARSPFVRTYLLEAHPVSFIKNVFTIGFEPKVEDHIGLVDNARNQSLLQTKLAELGHPNVQIKFIKAERPARLESPQPEPVASPPASTSSAQPVATAKSVPAQPPAPKDKLAPSAAFNKDDFKNDPLIQKALEIFKAHIVEVRT